MRQSKTTAREALQNVGRYAEAFRDLINARVWAKNESPFKALRLNGDSDWEFICVAMDVVGDAVLAIDDFLKFSLDGPTKYDNVGEKYLRLYGLLNAAYMQQEAVQKLFALMNCPSPKQIGEQFAKLEIRTLRHQVGSHSVDYRIPGTDDLSAFVPVRIGLSEFSCMVTEGRGDSTRTVKLDEAIEAHCVAIASVLDRIYEKSITTLFRNQRARIDEFKGTLNDLREQRDGNLIIRAGVGPDSKQVRVRFVTPDHSKKREYGK